MQLFTSLGFETPDETGEFSRERLDLIDTDVLIAFAKREDFENDPLYGRLGAVRAGYLSGSRGPSRRGARVQQSPLSLPFAIDGLVPRLAAAVDGDPETEVPSAS